MFNLKKLVRKNILQLKPYSSARHEFVGNASIYLDANENALGSSVTTKFCHQNTVYFNRYPDPLQQQLKDKLASIKNVPAKNIFIGNGSDEGIDLAVRIFCEPSKDNILICSPTYGMYNVCAAINNVAVLDVPLNINFQLQVDVIKNTINENTKVIFICSPNNPTGNCLNNVDIQTLLQFFKGIVVVDEAYIDFANQPSMIALLHDYKNLIVIQTMSKAWGLAALRMGLCFASVDIINIFNKVKPPYNINEATQQLGLFALQHHAQVSNWINQIIEQKKMVSDAIKILNFVKCIYHSDANFLLVKVDNANQLYQFLCNNGIIVRNRTNEIGCNNCLRITIGTPKENEVLLNYLNQFNQIIKA